MQGFSDLRRQLESSGRLVLSVKVTPKSSRNRIIGCMDDGTWKVAVAAAPEKGKANAELCEFLAGELGVPKSAVTVESGHTASRKRLKIVRPV